MMMIISSAPFQHHSNHVTCAVLLHIIVPVSCFSCCVVPGVSCQRVFRRFRRVLRECEFSDLVLSNGTYSNLVMYLLVSPLNVSGVSKPESQIRDDLARLMGAPVIRRIWNTFTVEEEEEESK